MTSCSPPPSTRGGVLAISSSTSVKETNVPDRDIYIIVGVVLDQLPIVVQTAATFAERFEAQLLCATVDPSRYTVDSTGAVMPLDPDQYDDAEMVFGPELHQQIDESLRDHPVRWITRLLAGGVAQELGRLADELGCGTDRRRKS